MTPDRLLRALALARRLRYDGTPVTDIEMGEASKVIFELLDFVEETYKEENEMTKPLTLLESVLVQILVQAIPCETADDQQVRILMRTGLTKQQANKALGR